MTPSRRVRRHRRPRIAALAVGSVLASLAFSAAPVPAQAATGPFLLTLTGPTTATSGQSQLYPGTVSVAGQGLGLQTVQVLIDGVLANTQTTNPNGSYNAPLTFETYGTHTAQAVTHAGDPLESRSDILTVQVTPPTSAGGTGTDIAVASSFLYEGTSAPQQGVAAGTITPTRAAVLHGAVRDTLGQPLAGVTVTVVGHPEFGSTTSRPDGLVDMAVNGGQPLTVTYTKTGFLPVDRTVDVAWRDFTTLPDVTLPALDGASNLISSGSNTVQVARGNPVTDTDGTRRATLLVPAGTSATMTLPNGTEQYLPSLHVRATEVTVGSNGPAAMPGDLPAATAYTYAVDYTVDEAQAANASTVTFDQPLAAYTDNFLHFTAGTRVPAGFYDRTRHAWVASQDGVVLKIISVTAGKAELDVTGDGTADSTSVLAGYGINDAERTTLATLYTAGVSLWRVQVRHFTPWDYNYPYGLPPGAQAPNQHGVPQPHTGCQSGGSIIGCTAQTLGEAVPITGTGMALRYDTSRVAGFAAKRSINIGLTGATVPAGLQSVSLKVTVGGRTYTNTFGTQPNQRYEFVWDGLDAFGRLVQGARTATVKIGYAYRATYYAPSGSSGSSSSAIALSFGQAGDAEMSGDKARGLIMLYQSYTEKLGGLLGNGLGDVGGWTLTAHHAYDPDSHTLYLGDGTTREATQLFSGVTSIAGTGTVGSYTGDGGPATAAGLSRVTGIAAGPDGSIYLADSDNAVIRKINPAGTISTIAGGGSAASGNGDGGPASNAILDHPVAVAIAPDGSLLIADPGANRIRSVSPDGIITSIAGGGTPTDGLGDYGPATNAALNNPRAVTVANDGTVYIADTDHNRIRKITPDGTISTVAGGGTPPDGVGDGLPGPQAALLRPRSIAAGTNQQLWIADTGHERVRTLGADGLIRTAAGTGTTGSTGDGGPALAATLDDPDGLAIDRTGSTVFITQSLTNTIRQLDMHGTLSTVAGTRSGGFSGDGGVPTQARFTHPNAVTVSPTGQLLIADTENYRIRKIAPALPGFALSDSYVPSADGSEVYHFDRTGRHLRTLDSLTNLVTASFGYNPAGQLVAVRDHFGNTTTINRDGNGLPTSIDAPYGQRTLLHLTSDGYLDQIIDPANQVVTLGYTPTGGLLTSYTDPRHNSSTLSYDSLGRLQSDTASDGHATTLTRTVTDSGVTVTATTAEGHTTSYGIGTTPAGGAVQAITSPTGGHARLSTGLDGTMTSTGPDGTTSRISPANPDPRFGLAVPLLSSSISTTPGGITSQTRQTRTVTLSDPTNPLTVTTLTTSTTTDGLTVMTRYDAAAHTLTTTSPSGISSTVTLNSDGQVSTVRRGSLLATTYGYDSRGRVLTVTTGSGPAARTTTYTYGPDGFLASLTNPLNQTTTYVRDAAGRVTDTLLPDGKHLGTGYDANSNLTSVTPPGRPKHGFTFTSGDQVSKYSPPTVDAADDSSSVLYNKDRQPTQATQPGNIVLGYSYDSAGRFASTHTAAGDIALGYDPSTGDLTTVAAPGTSTLQFAHDGPLLSSISTGAPVNRTVGYGYGAGQRITSRTITGAPTVTFGYDTDGILNAFAGETLTRDSNGLPSATSIGTITTATTPDGFGGLAHSSATGPTGSLYDATYSRDNLGRITDQTETVNGVTSTLGYRYDSRGRLTDVTQGATSLEHYSYDDNGNRTAATTPAGSVAAGYDNQDRLSSYGTATYTYTPNGDLASKSDPNGTTSYHHDELGHLTHVTLPTGSTLDYSYDGLGRRSSKSVNGTVTQRFLYGANRAPLAVLDSSGNVLQSFVYGRNGNSPDLIQAAGVTYRVIADHLGSPRLIVNTATGAIVQRLAYDPFGKTTLDTSPGFQPFGYAGGLPDADTGLVHFGARDYDPHSGRFTSKDPEGFAGGDTNLYAYVGNDPINATDPTGLSWYGDAWNWANKHLNPVYPIIEALAAEIDAYESGCSYLESVRIGLRGPITVGEMAVVGAAAGGVVGRLLDRVISRVAVKGADAAAVDVGHAGIHKFPGITAGKSQFFDGANLGQLSKTDGVTGVVQQNGNVRYVLRGTGDVGVDRTTGLPTDIYTVIRKPDGSVLTMFPGMSPKS